MSPLLLDCPSSVLIIFFSDLRIVEFASRRDMERAMDKFDDYELNGRRIKVGQITR